MQDNMKVVIKGVRYNTASSDRICTIKANSPNEFTHMEATLYRTKIAKRYFLAGRGGMLSLFARREQSSCWVGGDGVIPLNKDDARKLAKRYATAEDVARFFDAE